MSGATVPVFPWFDQAEPHMKTRRQLAELGMKPGGPVIARVEWRKGHALLFDARQAVPKRATSQAQRAVLAQGRETQQRARAAAYLASCTCPVCGTDAGFPLDESPEPQPCAVCRVRNCREKARAWLDDPRAVILDTETTSLSGYAVELAVIDMTGAVLFDGRLNPLQPISDDARRVHGIADADVAAAPTFAGIAAQLEPIIGGRNVIAYNSSFDAGIIDNELARLPDEVAARLRPRRWRCAMLLRARYIGEWSHHHGSYRWFRLDGGHAALSDVRACLRILQHIADVPPVNGGTQEGGR